MSTTVADTLAPLIRDTVAAALTSAGHARVWQLHMPATRAELLSA